MPSFTTKTLTLLFATAVSLTRATRFAQFCNDANCQEGCGTSVSVDNPGCLNEFGRGSIMFHGDDFQDISLIASPGPDCPCQNYCEEDIVQSVLHPNNVNPGCFTLRDEEAQSFRFVLEACPSDQC